MEGLTTGELLKLADSYGIDIPPGLDRTIIIEELLETTNENELGTDKKSSPPLVEKKQATSVPLPKQYNITFIEVLIRDPLWAFAFWEINAHDKEAYEGEPEFGGYYLKVSPAAPDSPDSSFTVSVEPGDTAWYLGFPPSGGTFRVEICVLRGGNSAVLAVSRPFRLPKLLASSAEEDASPGNPLIQLSGVNEFAVLRNTDRSSRIPKHHGF